MPFITERLWEQLQSTSKTEGHCPVPGLMLPTEVELLAVTRWPVAMDSLRDEETAAEFELMQRLVGAIREVRASHQISPRQKLAVSAKASPEVCQQLLALRPLVEQLAAMEGGELGPNIDRPDNAAAATVTHGSHTIELYILDVVDADAERDRLTRQRDDLMKGVKTMRGRLSNEGYVSKAPEKLVRETRDQLAAAEAELARVETELAAL